MSLVDKDDGLSPSCKHLPLQQKIVKSETDAKVIFLGFIKVSKEEVEAT